MAGRADVCSFNGASAAFQLRKAEVEGVAAFSWGVKVGYDKAGLVGASLTVVVVRGRSVARVVESGADVGAVVEVFGASKAVPSRRITLGADKGVSV